MNCQDVIRLLDLKPLPEEGGYYRETYKAPQRFTPTGYTSQRSFCTAIYYLLTPDQFSALHSVGSDEIFHFYAGDPVEMLMLLPDGTSKITIIGNDLAAEQTPQVVVSAGIWQGTRLKQGGKWALMGTTVAPGFEFADFELGKKEWLTSQYPNQAELIEKLSRG